MPGIYSRNNPDIHTMVDSTGRNSYESRVDAYIEYRKAAEKKLDKEIEELRLKGGIDVATQEYELRKKLEEHLKKVKEDQIKDENEQERAYQKALNDLNLQNFKNEQRNRLSAEQIARRAAQESHVEKLKFLAKELDYNAQLNKDQFAAEAELYKTRLLHLTKLGDKMAANGKSYAQNMMEAAASTVKAFNNGAEKYMDIYAQYMGAIDARLQDSGLNFAKINRQLRINTALNPYVQYTNLLSKTNELIDKGVANNVLQRAFLDEISQKIATTFDATNSSLLQLVRIQQADTTASRLGLEANLTRLFNHYFSDTSYLSDQFDNVQSILLDVSAQMKDQSAVEFEYITQKWLGALSSVGASSSTLQKIAQGLAYIGTGNIEAMSGDAALQNLFVMASQRAGLDYVSMFKQGISANQANTLLYNLIKYVQDIGTSDNNVVKSKYADIFGVTLTDIKAFGNLSANMNNLLSIGMTYSDTLTELENQLGNVGRRTHISEQINNLVQNALAGTGTGVAESPALYSIYKAASLLEKVTGGINLPFISVMGSGIDLNMSLEGLIKSGVLGIGAMSSLLGAVFSSGSGFGRMNLGAWNIESTKGRGFAGPRNAGELLQTTSNIAYAQSGSSVGITQSLVDQQRETGETVSGQEETESQQILALLEDILERLRDTLDVNVVNQPLYSNGVITSL